MRILRALAATSVLLAPSLVPPALADLQSRGPLPVRGQFPLDLVTLDLTPQSATMPKRGTTSLQMLVVHTNTFEITTGQLARATAHDGGVFTPGWDFVVDSETTRLSLSLGFQVARRVSLGFEAPFLSHGGGFMDSTIEDFHDTFGLPQNDRHVKDRDQIEIDLIGGATRARLDESDGAFGDVKLHAKVQLWSGRHSAWAALLEAKAPTGDEETFTGSGEWDYGVALLVSAGSRRHVFHGGVGHQVLGQPSTWPFEIEDGRTTAFAGYEFNPNERWSVVMHVMGASSILPEQGADYPQDGERAEVVVGFHWSRGRFTLSSGFLENVTTNDNDSDLSLVLGLGWEF